MLGLGMSAADAWSWQVSGRCVVESAEVQAMARVGGTLRCLVVGDRASFLRSMRVSEAGLAAMREETFPMLRQGSKPMTTLACSSFAFSLS